MLPNFFLGWLLKPSTSSILARKRRMLVLLFPKASDPIQLMPTHYAAAKARTSIYSLDVLKTVACPKHTVWSLVHLLLQSAINSPTHRPSAYVLYQRSSSAFLPGPSNGGTTQAALLVGEPTRLAFSCRASRWYHQLGWGKQIGAIPHDNLQFIDYSRGTNVYVSSKYGRQ
jgi:hypothetical protein